MVVLILSGTLLPNTAFADYSEWQQTTPVALPLGHIQVQGELSKRLVRNFDRLEEPYY